MEFPNDFEAGQSAGLPIKQTRGKQVLAIEPEFGVAFICGRCDHIHMQLGELHMRTDLAGFQHMVVLLNRAAANFELWTERQRSAA